MSVKQCICYLCMHNACSVSKESSLETKQKLYPASFHLDGCLFELGVCLFTVDEELIYNL